jgi:hypothetical protein
MIHTSWEQRDLEMTEKILRCFSTHFLVIGIQFCYVTIGYATIKGRVL